MENSTTCDFSSTEARFDAFLFIAIAVTSLFGNVVVLVCYARYRALRSTTNLLLISLSASDLLVATTSIPLTFGMYLCQLRPPDFVYLLGDMLPSVSSIYSLTLVAMDRAIAVTNPFSHKKYVNQKSARIAVVVMWVFVTFVVSLIMILDPSHFTLFIIFMSYIFPVAIMVISYMLMGYIASKHAKAITRWEKISYRHHGKQNGSVIVNNGIQSSAICDLTLLSDDDEQNEHSNQSGWHAKHRAKYLFKEFKAALTLLFLLAVFVIAWTPFMALNIQHYRCPTCYIDLRLVKYFKMLHYSNSALNPILYILLSKRWKAAFRMVLHLSKSSGTAEETISEMVEWE